jgi:predicted PurR-regulated permease PerM
MPDRVADVGVLSRPRVKALALLAATAVSLYVCYLLVQPFVPALSWGLALAVVGYPLHKAICRRIPQATIAAALTVAVIAVAIIGPVAFVVQQLVRQVTDVAARAQRSLETGSWRQMLEQEPHVAAVVGWVESAVSLDDAVPRLATAIQEWAPTVLLGSVAALMQLLITVLVLFYFFRDKRDLAADARTYLPLSERETDIVVRRITDTIQATIFGSLTVAAVQGFMGGLMFWLLGLPAPVVWGAVMAVLATIPVAGTFVVWAPTAVFLAVTGAWGKALILAGWGAVAIGLIDNLLYPMLVGRRLRFHPLPVFFSIVGGLSVFGAAGLVLGPLALSITAALLEVLRTRTSRGATADVIDMGGARRPQTPRAPGRE